MSRAIVVIGMHRSGTSAVARGLQALSVYLGDDLLPAQPENPTGYWEDKQIVNINERVLGALRLRWDDAAPIDPREFERWRLGGVQREAIRYLERRFLPQPLWGFKDPRTMRVLPFWRRILRDARVDDAYVLVIRNPFSIAASLFARQEMDLEAAQRLWLVYDVPFLHLLADKPLVVVDYDLLMQDPRGQMERIARKLEIPENKNTAAEVDDFADHFLDVELRHSHFSESDIDTATDVGVLTRRAYVVLYELALDTRQPDHDFWQAWKRIETSCRTRLGWPDTE